MHQHIQRQTVAVGERAKLTCVVRFHDSYVSKCPSYHAKKACGTKCRYKNCLNPHGQKVHNTGPGAVTSSAKRVQASHEIQSYSLHATKGQTFMEEVGEPIITGPSTNMELLLVALIM